ncbi:MAG: c-type cytochrome domain-containing protein [Verrucomicrobiota bacterium]
MKAKRQLANFLGWLGFAVLVSASAAEPISYNRDVRPILSDSCFHCHGPDQKTRKGKFRLDVREDAVAKGAIVPGKPEASEFITRIFTENPEEVMPPAESHKTLTTAQKELLRRWIASGAKYEKHWAYVPPTRSVLPPTQNPIDALIRQRLRGLGLKPCSAGGSADAGTPASLRSGWSAAEAGNSGSVLPGQIAGRRFATR